MSIPNSKVNVANLSLALLRQAPISNLDSPTTATERLCAQFVDQVRREVLRSHTWNFASKRCVLTKMTEAPAFGFSAQFQLPNDYMRPVEINDKAVTQLDCEFEDHKLLIDSDNGNSLNLKYIYDHTNISRWDPLALKLWYHQLAIAMSPQLTGGYSAIEKLVGYVDDLEQKACSIDGQERPPKRIQNSRAINARRGFRSIRTDIIED